MLVVYVKGRTFRLPGLDGVRVDSLDTALENKTSPVLLRFNSASPDEVATLTYNLGAGTRRARAVMNTHKNWLSGAAFAVDTSPWPSKTSLFFRCRSTRVWLCGKCLPASGPGRGCSWLPTLTRR